MTMDNAEEAHRLSPEQRVGAALRQAREDGGLSLRELAKRLGYNSHTTLSAYERGSVMPTDQVIEGYERVLGLPDGPLKATLEEANIARHGDAWAKRRTHVPAQLPPVSGETPVIGPTVSSGRRRTVIVTGAMAAVIALVAGAILLAVNLVSAKTPAQVIASNASPRPIVVSANLDQADPVVAGCAAGAVSADTVDVFDPPEYIAGVLDLRYSSACGTSWGRFVPSAILPATPQLVIEINLGRPADGAKALYRLAYSAGQTTYGNMLMSRNECVYAEVILHRSDKSTTPVRTACRRGSG